MVLQAIAVTHSQRRIVIHGCLIKVRWTASIDLIVYWPELSSEQQHCTAVVWFTTMRKKSESAFGGCPLLMAWGKLRSCLWWRGNSRCCLITYNHLSFDAVDSQRWTSRLFSWWEPSIRSNNYLNGVEDWLSVQPVSRRWFKDKDAHHQSQHLRQWQYIPIGALLSPLAGLLQCCCINRSTCQWAPLTQRHCNLS